MFVVFIVGITAVPSALKKLKQEEKNKFLTEMEYNGSIEQKQRAKQIRQREGDKKLKLMEFEQAASILDSPEVRKKFEESNIDIEEMKRLLSGSSDDEILKEYKLLERKTKEKE